MNKKGEIGSPYLNPLSIGILSKTLALSSSSIEIEEMQDITRLTNFTKKPKRVKILDITAQFTQS